MEIFLLKVKCNNLTNFQDNTLDVDFIATKQVSKQELEENIVTHLFNRIYKLNTLAFVGINASGKTTTMNILSSVLEMYLGNSSLSYNMKISQYFANALEIESYYYEKKENCIYKIYSKILKDDSEKSIYFENEILYKKAVTAQTSKDSIFSFSDEDIILYRNEIVDSFLKHEDSIFSSLMNTQKPLKYAIMNMCDTTDHNFLSAYFENMVMSYIKYLDPSIEKFEKVTTKSLNSQTTSPPMFKIKFYGQKNIITADIFELKTYLSSGTIKGITFFSSLCPVLDLGGYILIDEIENHFNKTIVANIIKMLTSKLNKNSATMLFSTHYSEILDVVDRSDSIYVLNKQQRMQANKFSKIAGEYDRIDKKKSDIILSGLLNTAPKYKPYQELLKAFEDKLDRGEPDD